MTLTTSRINKNKKNAAGLAALLIASIAAAGGLPTAASTAGGNACATPAATNGNIDCSNWFPACEHPWPCADGSEWPDELVGQNFTLAKVVPYNVTRPGNVTLAGWIGMPNVPAGTPVPVLLEVSPGWGFCSFSIQHMVLGTIPQTSPVGPGALPAGTCLPTPEDRTWWEDKSQLTTYIGWGVAPIDLVQEGYAVALFSQRGTGPSGGCFEAVGLVQNGDEKAIIESLASESWSNGRVGIGGYSASAGTAMLGATSGASALKTTVVGGTLNDGYTFAYTPQGAASAYTVNDFSWGQAASASVMSPLVDTNGATDGPAAFVEAYPQRVERFEERASCPETMDGMTSAQYALQDDRNPEFWERQRTIDDFDNVTASLLVVDGVKDNCCHAWQDTYFGPMVSAPMRQIKGQWGHYGWPITEMQPPGTDVLVDGTEWHDIVVPWLDFWLKGLGPKPDALGRVNYKESGGTWHTSSSWPPVEAQDEVVYLAGKTLSATPGTGARAFQSIPVTGNNAGLAEYVFGLPSNAWPAACDQTDPLVRPTTLVYKTPPLEETVVLAGNPFAYLKISSNLPGGIVSINVWEVPADHCTEVGNLSNVHLVAYGAADLRFHQGNMIGTDFPFGVLPTGPKTPVRVDLWDVAETVEKGNQLLVILSYGEDFFPYSRISQPFYPTITVYGDSHLVLPFIEGTMGGDEPTIAYPPRPFMDL